MKYFNLRLFKEISFLIWLLLIIFISIVSYIVYSNNQTRQSNIIKSSFENIYLKKIIKEITTNLEPRYTTINYYSKAGDTYESIISSLLLDKEEKKLILDTILSVNSLKILRINQRFIFKYDHLSEKKVREFIIETDKKNEIIFSKKINKENFNIKKI